MECATEDSCPYLGKDFACESRSDMYEEILRVLSNYLLPEAAFERSINFQNLIGKKHCFGDYSSCLYYQSKEKKKYIAESEAV
jgi:hypothetical protein